MDGLENANINMPEEGTGTSTSTPATNLIPTKLVMTMTAMNIDSEESEGGYYKFIWEEEVLLNGSPATCSSDRGLSLTGQPSSFVLDFEETESSLQIPPHSLSDTDGGPNVPACARTPAVDSAKSLSGFNYKSNQFHPSTENRSFAYASDTPIASPLEFQACVNAAPSLEISRATEKKSVVITTPISAPLLSKFYRQATKYCLRRFTRLSELQRIIYGELRGSKRIRLVELSLRRSTNREILAVIKRLDEGVDAGTFDLRIPRKNLIFSAAHAVAKAKAINAKLHTRFITGMRDSIECIWAYGAMNIKIELVRSVAFSHDNQDHVAKLLELWNNLMAPETLSAVVSRQWQTVGFQGSDPGTDFRGAGYLALEVMSYLAQNHTDVARQLLGHSRHPNYSYPFALLSIQMTFFAYEICRKGLAKTHFYNRVGLIVDLDGKAGVNDTSVWGSELMDIFYEFVCCLMVEFDSQWFAYKPKDIMEFGKVKKIFDTWVAKRLKDDKVCFLMDVRTI